MIAAVRLGTALVWIVFGLGFKVFDLVPRHRAIVDAILGSKLAAPVTLAIGIGETGLGIWILSGRMPRTCAAVQTAAIVAMNALELTRSRGLLLAPMPMVCANAVFLAAGWYLALNTARPAR